MAHVWAQVADSSGRTATSRLHAPEPYTLTVGTALESVRRGGGGGGGGLLPCFPRSGPRPGTPVVVWPGDNPASLVGTGAWGAGAAGGGLGTRLF